MAGYDTGDIGVDTGPRDAVFSLAGARQLVYLPPPWGDCKATPIESDFFTNYSLTACRLDCETRYLAENCNCRMVHMPGEPRARPGPGSALQCGSTWKTCSVSPQAMPLTAPRSSTRSAQIRP